MDSRSELINNILELQETLEDLVRRVDTVKVTNAKTREDTQLLSAYLEEVVHEDEINKPLPDNIQAIVAKTLSLQ
ncbi:short coiled-coil protein A-like [Planoprotostelium fungivorum]|uniref:Short coiled-coil protein A-like n=1 Tax=Planoprotostelium fungivorum TaxID=1890364 RepID=A0A2P6NVW3_9EUKA|nr:short coiled-coil protein A-like [Planoprotostelium fungivorum]